uniref:Uncharacterized protein n=1 Tax=Brassica campestris TaxID=3711 RepID=M4FCR8_BRACM
MASEDEIHGARNFLIQQYAGHKPSVDAIESAHDNIIMQKFHERKHPKIDITKKTAVTFAVLGALTVLFPTEEGPTLQVLLSLISSSYVLLHPPKAEEEALVFPLRVISKAHHNPKTFAFWHLIILNIVTKQDWIFYLIVADWDLLDGICDPTVHQRTTRFRSHVFAHKLHFALGGFELP